MNNLKKHVFFELLSLAGRVFILVRYSDNVVLGKRGFSAEEKENGIVLVFNPKMNFSWDEYGITVTLVFGTSPQKCFIPVEDITAIYSPELNAQFIMAPRGEESRKSGAKEKIQAKDSAGDKVPSPESSENVIKVDFTRKTKDNKNL